MFSIFSTSFHTLQPATLSSLLYSCNRYIYFTGATPINLNRKQANQIFSHSYHSNNWWFLIRFYFTHSLNFYGIKFSHFSKAASVKPSNFKHLSTIICLKKIKTSNIVTASIRVTNASFAPCSWQSFLLLKFYSNTIWHPFFSLVLSSRNNISSSFWHCDTNFYPQYLQDTFIVSLKPLPPNHRSTLRRPMPDPNHLIPFHSAKHYRLPIVSTSELTMRLKGIQTPSFIITLISFNYHINHIQFQVTKTCSVSISETSEITVSFYINILHILLTVKAVVTSPAVLVPIAQFSEEAAKSEGTMSVEESAVMAPLSPSPSGSGSPTDDENKEREKRSSRSKYRCQSTSFASSGKSTWTLRGSIAGSDVIAKRNESHVADTASKANVLQATDNHFRSVIKYINYCLLNRLQFNNMAAKPKKYAKKRGSLMNAYNFDYKYPITILRFLAQFKQTFDSIRVSKGTAFWVLHN